jgi:hypothetical protein
MPRIAKVMKRARAASMIAGLKKRFAPDHVFALRNVKYTRQELIALCQAQIDALDAVAAAAVAAAAARARERAAARRLQDVTQSLKAFIGVTFGDRASYGDFGWEAPKKPGPKTVAAKARGAERLRETRRLRGTMGKRQRKAALRKLRSG